MNLVRAIFLFLTFSQTAALADDKFVTKAAVVDVESILEHSIAIANIKKSLNLISDQIQSELSAKEHDLKIIENDLTKQRGLVSAEEFDEMVIKFNKNVSAVQQEMQQKKSSLEQSHTNALAEVHNTTIAIIGELSKKYGFNLVLPSSQVLFAENNLNITLEVISNLNERLKEVEVQYKPESKD